VLKDVTGIDEPIEVILEDTDLTTIIYKSGKEAHISNGSYNQIIREAE
jgi:hypothetical protein